MRSAKLLEGDVRGARGLRADAAARRADARACSTRPRSRATRSSAAPASSRTERAARDPGRQRRVARERDPLEARRGDRARAARPALPHRRARARAREGARRRRAVGALNVPSGCGAGSVSTNVAPSFGPRAHVDRAAVRLGDRARDEEAEPGAGLRGAGHVGAAELLEDQPLLVVRDPGAVVGDGDAHGAVLAAATRTSTSSPAGEYLIALSIRFVSTWRSRSRSPRTARQAAPTTSRARAPRPARSPRSRRRPRRAAPRSTSLKL